MISYLPKKPGKYGLVIRVLCVVSFYNGYVSNGDSSNGVGLTTQDKKLLLSVY